MKFYIVDVFAENKYQGNQLAVFIPDGDLQTQQMQQIAREINFSETTFIISGKKPNGGYDCRYFTPDVEIPFAGHPTLGTAYIIHHIIEQRKSDKILLNLEVGEIPVTVCADIFTMEQKEPEFGIIAENPEKIAKILRINKDDIDEKYPIQVVSTGLPSLIVPLKSYDALKRCAVNHERYQNFIDNIVKCNLLAFFPESEETIRVRVFVDDPGFVEDAATGSANGNLAGYILKYEVFDNHETSYHALQGYEMNRPSLLRVTANLTDERYTIKVGGKVFLIAEGIWV
ncbi:MAG: PhzF family phenazine biosynthesis protein [Oscillospiraceae bacterium]|nr:PhzF family phenazine biosynthesis protein [Oscillospiraceae bacterium]